LKIFWEFISGAIEGVAHDGPDGLALDDEWDTEQRGLDLFKPLRPFTYLRIERFLS
jgi:hypothetical protein